MADVEIRGNIAVVSPQSERVGKSRRTIQNSEEVSDRYQARDRLSHARSLAWKKDTECMYGHSTVLCSRCNGPWRVSQIPTEASRLMAHSCANHELQPSRPSSRQAGLDVFIHPFTVDKTPTVTEASLIFNIFHNEPNDSHDLLVVSGI